MENEGPARIPFLRGNYSCVVQGIWASRLNRGIVPEAHSRTEGAQSWLRGSRVGRKEAPRSGHILDLLGILRVSLATVKNRSVGVFRSKINT